MRSTAVWLLPTLLVACFLDSRGVGVGSDGDSDADGECSPKPETCNNVDDDCDGLVDEVFDLESDPNHCGTCARTCSGTRVNGWLGCVDGQCTLVCAPGFADCDGEADTGCEEDLRSVEHCGGCGAPCAPDHGRGSCASGVCLVDGCDGGWDDCDGLVSDGCEADLESDETCGHCDRSCDDGHSSCECRDGTCATDQDNPCYQECAPGELWADEDCFVPAADLRDCRYVGDEGGCETNSACGCYVGSTGDYDCFEPDGRGCVRSD